MEEKIVFIDRDGVINRDGSGITEHGYILRWEDWTFLPGVLEAFRRFREAGYRTVVVSNQKCVARGLISREDLNELTEKFTGAIERAGGRVEKVYYCPHSDEDGCPCRKPKPGLFNKAAEEMGISSLAGKYMIGDSERDIEAGRKAGLKTILVLSGKAGIEDADNWSNKPDLIFPGLLEAAESIIEEGQRDRG